MSDITVDDHGHSLYYEDTGSPPNAEDIYTTLMIVHGTGFHGQIFRRLLPFALQHYIRLVFISRRDYPGSSAYTDEDLEKINTDSAEMNNEFAEARAAEFARFIKTFIEKENIPRASSDWKRGGIVLMAWSSGNAYTLPLLSYADSIPGDTRLFIEPYLRSLILFDMPRWIVGALQLPDALRDLSLSEEERVQRFNIWVSSYYSHKSLASRNLADLQSVADDDPSIRKSTYEVLTPEEIKETAYAPPSTGSELAFRNGSPAIYAERVRRAIFDDKLAKYWPRAGVDVVWGEESIWVVVGATWELQKAREKANEEGIVGRPLRFFMIPGANHFPHWDEPEMTMKFFADIIDP
ncbi:hypothetical protein A7U60_g7428 [Sanghuangporus baumii]|uniref:AB hydrolase-1 domain-containing protein n=1 Tax=Sanghuangporus baumii TaxID=108892 RepID=A0A9Q5HT12_SANBA|nr:hypothetical protein A7U60_g7428 [Sanghuangporus baumii]